MMQRTRMLTIATMVSLAVNLLGIPQRSWAGSQVFDSVDSSFSTLKGSVETNAAGNVDPWVVQMFAAGGNECLRIQVTSQGADLEASLISPSGRFWRNDDGFGSLRPLIAAVTDVRGWYTLQLSHYAGAATNADFTLQFGRFTAGSSQCAAPTTSSFAASEAAAGDNIEIEPGPTKKDSDGISLRLRPGPNLD